MVGINGIYSKRLKAIRGYVKFNYDLRKKLSSAQKANVTKYFRKFETYLGSSPVGVRVFRPRKKANLQAAKAAANQTDSPQFKVAFLPSGDRKAKVSIKDNRFVSVTSPLSGIKERFIPMPANIVIQPSDVIAQYIRDNNGEGGQSYGVQAERYQIKNTKENPEEIALGLIEALAEQYVEAPEFITGVNVYNFRSQKQYVSFENRIRESTRKRIGRATTKKKRRKSK